MHKTFRIIFALTAITLTVALIAGESTSASASLISQGEAQLAGNDIDGAVTTLTQAVQADPTSTLAHTRLGGALLLGQQYDAAIEQFQQAIALDSETHPRSSAWASLTCTRNASDPPKGHSRRPSASILQSPPRSTT